MESKDVEITSSSSYNEESFEESYVHSSETSTEEAVHSRVHINEITEINQKQDTISELNIEIVNSVVFKTVYDDHGDQEIPIKLDTNNQEEQSGYENKGFTADDEAKLAFNKNETIEDLSNLEDASDSTKCKNVFFFGKLCSLFHKNNNHKQIIVRF